MKFIPCKHLTLVSLGLGIACFTLPAHAQTFTSAAGTDSMGNYDYNTPGNWSSGSVPATSNGATAVINNGATVDYFGGSDGGDLIVSNGGELEISNGTFQQVQNNNYIQLGEQGSGAAIGNGTILVNGGTFDQGTDSAEPFNLTGTGNTFTITSGAANFDSPFAAAAGLTVNINGGTTSITGELDYDSTTFTLAGGVLNTTLITGVNGPAGSTLTISGGLLNLSSGTGIYGASSTDPVNFTAGSTGSIDFEAVSASQVNAYLTSGAIEYNGLTDPSAFLVTSTGADSSLLTAIVAAPEPSTYGLFGLGFAVLLVAVRRRSARV